jgi:hypothetical protein
MIIVYSVNHSRDKSDSVQQRKAERRSIRRGQVAASGPKTSRSPVAVIATYEQASVETTGSLTRLDS